MTADTHMPRLVRRLDEFHTEKNTVFCRSGGNMADKNGCGKQNGAHGVYGTTSQRSSTVHLSGHFNKLSVFHYFRLSNGFNFSAYTT